jgi:divalent metal cation (Fe/Co/Zn/Cd) transporter
MRIVSDARALAVRQGVRLEVITVGWMAAEAVIAVGAGIAAKSVLLTAFGFDSVVELVSGIVLLRRLAYESGGADGGGVERMERTATLISAVLLVLLCAYVVLSSIAGLAIGVKPDASAIGLVVAAIALIAMPLLARAKRGVNRTLDSPSLRADIAETMSCAFLAAVTLAGLGLSMLSGWWWMQYIAALALLIWLVPETREAIQAALPGGHDNEAEP